MTHQGLVLQRVFFCFSVLFMITSKLVESTTSDEKVSDSKTKAAQDKRTVPLSTSSIHRTNEVLKPSQIRNRRSNLLTEKGQLIDDNPGLDSAFMYSDQIIQNLLQSPRPLNYARSNFFLNLLKPRTTRYNAWDDHSLLHFGKRSLENINDADKILVKRSADLWTPNNVLPLGKKSENPAKDDEPFQDGIGIPNSEADEQTTSQEIVASGGDVPDSITEPLNKKSDPWHNMMSFGKKSENPWDHSTLHFGKRDDPWHNMMSFGKRDDPWHNMMSFGKRDEPWHNMMSFGKKSDNPWDHSTLHFGKRDDPWHNMMSFGKRPANYDMADLEKRDDPWHNMMSFGKRYDNLGNNGSTVSADKRDEPWHSMMSFGKKSGDGLGEHFTLHFGKKDEPWHSMMSFGKKSDLESDQNTLQFGKREDPWHSMMSFGKKSESPWDYNTLHFGKKDEPWHNMMSFGKKSDSPWGEHNTMHFGKKQDPWHNMMSFGKRPDRLAENDLVEDFRHNSNPWEDYNAMVFYKKSNPWDHNTLHFGKKSNASLDSTLSTQKVENPNVKHIQKRSVGMGNDHHAMYFGKKSEPWESHNTMHFGKKSELEDFENSMNDDKRFDWEHNNLHFGKKSDPWESHNTMHFGKKSDPWDYHNTMMHFGKRNPWEYHNTMHFGKKRDPWDYHNTMHFGKRSDPILQNDDDTLSQGNTEIKNDDENQEPNYNTNEVLESNTADNEGKVEVKKRSAEALKSNSNPVKYPMNDDSNNKKPLNNEVNKLNDNQKLALQSRLTKRSLKSAESTNQKNPMISNDKQKYGYDLAADAGEEQGFKPPSASILTDQKDHKKNQPHAQENNTKSRINKRSIESAFNTHNGEHSGDLDTNTGTSDEYPKDIFPDTVLNFGKLSVDDPEDSRQRFVAPWSHSSKRFDDYWDNHNTLHFGKKSEPWDSHSTLHFGKKSNPWEQHSTMHFGKRDPWDYHNTLHFGKKFDPWEGHTQMHFGKRSAGWDHNVMHFGKRGELTTDDLLNILDAEGMLTSLLDPVKLRLLLEEIEGINIAGNKQLLEDLENLETLVSTYSKDENMPYEEKLFLLKSYLKPILKAILSREIPEEALKSVDGEEVNNNGITEDVIEVFPGVIGDINYDGISPTEGEDADGREYDGNSKLVGYLKYKNFLKSKRDYLGKPELKRYFVPFQGPKSIVYPHAWFASQIRRSAHPRTKEYARNLEMRMAEKKEDPFNSYMHFGRR